MMHYLGPALVALFVLSALSDLVGPKRRRKTRGVGRRSVLSPVARPEHSGEAPVVAKPLLTDFEVSFWHVLRSVAGPYHVAPQVAMNALLNAAPGIGHGRWWSTRNQFDKKVVDFALVDDHGRVRLLIELDDWTHLAKVDSDARRDRMTGRAGYTTLRVRGREAREPDQLALAIAGAIGFNV